MGWDGWVVQGESDRQRDVWDVESLAGHLLPAGSVFRFLAEHRDRLFPDALFADLFASGRGRPSIPAGVVASVIVLQTLHGLSDREAADAATFDRFVLWISATDPKWDAAEAERFVRSLGADGVRLVDVAPPPSPGRPGQRRAGEGGTDA